MPTRAPEEVLVAKLREAVGIAKYWSELDTKDVDQRKLELQHLYAWALHAGELGKLLTDFPISEGKRVNVAREVDDLLRELRQYTDYVPTKRATEIVRAILEGGETS